MQRLAGGQRLLIGFDFAFSFPYEECGYLGGQARGIENIFALWEMIEAKSSGDSDFGCSQFIGHPKYAPLFWKAGDYKKAAAILGLNPRYIYRLAHNFKLTHLHK